MKIKIKELYGLWREGNWAERQKETKSFSQNWKLNKNSCDVIISYNFEKLKKDLQKNGLKTPLLCSEITTKPLEDMNLSNTQKQRFNYYNICKDFKYTVKDGNHRACILEELYGGDHKVEITLKKNNILTTN